MKKTKFLVLSLGFLALASCKNQDNESDGPLSANAKNHGTIFANGIEAETFTPPTRTYGTTTVNVQDFNTTTSDDTKAFQDAVNALPTTGSNIGGTVWIPAGTYYINGDFRANPGDDPIGGTNGNPTNCIKLRSNMRLLLSPYAHIKQIATDAFASMVVYAYNIENVTIEGQISGTDTSEIVGERVSTDSIGEGGHGIHLRGARHVTIKNLKLNEFHGDGMSISSTLLGTTGDPLTKVVSSDVVIDNIHSHHNRRQGLSIGPSNNVQVWDSEFSNTDGTAPKCGIDIEPETNLYADTVLIQNNIFRANTNNGINLHSARARHVDIKHNNIISNGAAGVISNGDDAYIAFNLIHDNGAGGKGVGATLMKFSIGNTIVQNTFYQNNGYAARIKTYNYYGYAVDDTVIVSKDIFVNDSASTPVVYTNTYK